MSDLMEKEIVQLRAENAALKKELERYQKQQAPPKDKHEKRSKAVKLIEEAKELVTDIQEEWQESGDNTEEYFPSKAEEYQEHADACGEAYDNLEQAESNLDW